MPLPGAASAFTDEPHDRWRRSTDSMLVVTISTGRWKNPESCMLLGEVGDAP